MQVVPVARRHERRRPDLTVESRSSVRLPKGLPLTGPVTFTITEPIPTAVATGTDLIRPVRNTQIVSNTPAGANTTPSSQPSPSIPTSLPTTQPSPDTTSASTGGSTSGASSKGLSNGAIAGIVIAVLFVVGAVALLLTRKASVFFRKRKRATWGGNVFIKAETAMEKAPSAGTPANQYAFQPQTVLPPPMSYNNVGSDNALPATSITTPTSRASKVPAAATATVRCTFIPNLPDELSITTGETVQIVSEYDDGWALCKNGSGDQGMVPLECLEKTAPTLVAPSGAADWRSAQRASSLATGNARY